jgi:hypothetical protein
MLTLNTITLFYHEISYSTNDKPSGLIESWSADVKKHTAAKLKTSAARSISTVPSSTLVSQPLMSQTGIKRPGAKKAAQPLSEPLPLMSASDEEWLKGKNPVQKQGTTAVSHCHTSFMSWNSHQYIYFQGIVAIKNEGNDEEILVDKEGPGGGSIWWNNSHLPRSSLSNNSWCRVFIPTLINFLATYKDPWAIKDSEAIRAMQKIWDCVYLNRFGFPDIPYTVVANQAVFSVVSPSFHRGF